MSALSHPEGSVAAGRKGYLIEIRTAEAEKYWIHIAE